MPNDGKGFWQSLYESQAVGRDSRNVVVLTRKKGDKPESAVMTFAPDDQSFEVLDFDKKRRITGKRVP